MIQKLMGSVFFQEFTRNVEKVSFHSEVVEACRSELRLSTQDHEESWKKLIGGLNN